MTAQPTLVTWNVNSVHARLDRVLAFLERWRPEIVCLQEVKCVTEQFPFEAFHRAGYFSWVAGQKAYNGVAILSREMLTEVREVKVREEIDGAMYDDDARVIGARRGDTWIYSVYVPNGRETESEAFQQKIRWLERLRRLLRERHDLRSESVILLGDFNIAPEDVDVYDPEGWREQTLCTSRERTALKGFAEDGLADCLRTLDPQGVQYTWWDYRMAALEQNRGLRIDLALATERARQGLTEMNVDREERCGVKPSDHAPVMIHGVVPRAG